MLDCNCLIHPFQNDPGTSQRQRIMDELLSGAAKIDARTLADLLDYFVQLSRHINYYDLDLNVSDWQPFFKNSTPFAIASIIKYPVQNAEENFALYNSLFDKKPSATGLQLITFFIYYRFINKINDWHLTLKDSGLPLESDIEVMIKNKLREPVMAFIRYANAAMKSYSIKRIDFTSLQQNEVWGIGLTDLYAIDNSFKTGTKNKFKRINNLYNDFTTLYPAFLDAIKTLSIGAEKNLEQSFIPFKEELQKKHQPQLALLFAFLNMFRQLQDDLNKYTRRHLDFFYKDILQFKSAAAVPDKAHIVFEIQKQLKNYLVKKGIKVKDGKDDNKQEMLFSLDDDIVVTKTTIADKRTLFLNNQDAYAQTYIEGVYMAPVAEKADGVEQDFPDDPKNFPTVGAKYSKYIDPETKLIKPYPNARLGFILGSQVLFLQAGSSRTINIDLDCYLDSSLCDEIASLIGGPPKNCCDDNAGPAAVKETYPNFYLPEKFFNDVNNALAATYYYFNQDLLKQAVKKGIGNDLAAKLRTLFLLEQNPIYDPGKPIDYCTNCPSQKDKYEGICLEADYFLAFTPAEIEILSVWIKPRKPLNLLFSGEKDWVEPIIGKPVGDPLFPLNFSISLGALSFSGGKFRFTLTMKAVLTPDKPAVTFYDKEKLNEDFGTTQPVAKIELDDKIKLIDIPLQNKTSPPANSGTNCCVQTPDCCLVITEPEDKHTISLYHFFRNVLVDTASNAAKSIITVDVCGLKNFVVQNDESVMDVNGLIYPFGTRPDVPDFDVVNPKPLPQNLVGPNFYIGSPEILCKNWNQLFVNIKWKDQPGDFNDYYKAYILRGAVFGLNKDDFQINIAVMENGKWTPEDAHALPNPPPLTTTLNNGFNNRPLFEDDGSSAFCGARTGFDQTIQVSHSFFTGLDKKFKLTQDKVTKLDVNTRNGFLKINLQNQDFCHKDYAIVLARQMMALGRLPNELLTNAVYKDSSSNTVFVFSDAFNIIDSLATDVTNASNNADSTKLATQQTVDDIAATIDPTADAADANTKANNTKTAANAALVDITSLTAANSLFPFFTAVNRDKLEALIPNEPWTPTISNISLDYEAAANLADVDLIHLYPYTGTYKSEEIELEPTLFPTFCDEGTLFLGLKDLVPGDNLNILFQLAEATSDSESDPEDVFWYYLDSNIWKPLRNGFEVIDDATKNLTTSGIIKLSLPANMTKDNTVMPKNLHWIKAAIAKNSRAVSETIAIIPQAILSTFTNDDANDKLRLSKPLVAGSISKLNDADASVKSVGQPFDSFNGAVPEIEKQFYVRVSETLRHKGRGIQAFDYERLALQAFPQVYKAKCINHSFALNAHIYSNDFPYAPGYIILAVIPDLNKLKAGNSFEPKVPVSMIEDIQTYIRKRISPFVRFRAMNPRYEKINFCLRVQLIKGKDENYFKEKLKQDIREFLAPWAVGLYDKLTFGQCIYRSDIIRLLETSDYVDFITDFRMAKENQSPSADAVKICPDTPRSILIAGDIEVCIEKPGCETWSTDYKKCGEQDSVVAPCDTKPALITDYCK
ncbi:MAG: hypothetical protein JST75_02125 [Bacteroidetes bacterium]|nr:hypothetical protein [Bacteroidota bacterium]